MKRLFLFLLLIGSLSVLAFVSVHKRAPRFIVVGVGAEASPTNYVGPCPATIKFYGKIQADAAGIVKYVWSRSDGTSGPVQIVTFTGPGVQYVSDFWTVPFSGWERIKILSPNELSSNEADFTVTCTSR